MSSMLIRERTHGITPDKNMNKKKIGLISIGILVFLFFVFLWFGPPNLLSWQTMRAVYTNNWYAIYLDNGQVLYGQIEGLNRNTMKLTNIYYIQSIEVDGKTTNNLTRRGVNEISGPENYLFVNRDHVTYWEQVGENSQVMNIINQQK